MCQCAVSKNKQHEARNVIRYANYLNMKKSRPPLIHFSSVCELYRHFERLFLGGNSTSHTLESTCGHKITVFDHHFFHVVKLDHPEKSKPLLMSNEKTTILATQNGFGPYSHDRQRAIYLESAVHCLCSPDEVWDDPTLDSARWIYITEYDTSPYSHTILLVGERGEDPVVVTSFPAKRRNAQKWRRGKLMYVRS